MCTLTIIYLNHVCLRYNATVWAKYCLTKLSVYQKFVSPNSQFFLLLVLEIPRLIFVVLSNPANPTFNHRYCQHVSTLEEKNMHLHSNLKMFLQNSVRSIWQRQLNRIQFSINEFDSTVCPKFTFSTL